jgi:ankyrin repeat protein
MSRADPNTGTNGSNGTTNPKDLLGEGGAPQFEPSGDEMWPLHVSDSPLHKAAYTGDVLLLASLISNCDDVDALSFYECTPLHLAIRGNHATAVSLLLSAGSDPSIEDTMDVALFPSHNAVDLAAYTGASHAMAALIDAGLSVPASTFVRCASLNHVGCMETIFDNLAGLDAFSNRSKIDVMSSALRQAALCWHLEAVEFILTRVAGLPDRNVPEHQTALGEALAAMSDLEFICLDECRWWPDTNPSRFCIIKEKLIAAGADLDIERNEAFWKAVGDSDTIRGLLKDGLRHDSQTKEGHTPLFGLVSAENDDISLVQAVIASGANVNHRDGVFRTPMHYATKRATAEVLYKYGADLFAKDKSGMTPLHMACKNGYPDVVQFLLSEGAAVNETAIADLTPLLYVTFFGQDECETFPLGPYPYTEHSRLEVAKILLDQGAKINVATTDGKTTLHGAAWSGELDFIHYLVEHGANVRAVDANGVTPLHNIVCTASIEAVRYLIDQRADIHAVTADGRTILHAACGAPLVTELQSLLHVLELLLDRGVEVNARDATGSTALHILYVKCYRFHCCSPEAFNFLLRRGADRSITNHKGQNVLELVQGDVRWNWNDSGFLTTRKRTVT